MPGIRLLTPSSLVQPVSELEHRGVIILVTPESLPFELE